eukprot:scaffold2151_cov99-Isochrysis_galbana.AAC.7
MPEPRPPAPEPTHRLPSRAPSPRQRGRPPGRGARALPRATRLGRRGRRHPRHVTVRHQCAAQPPRRARLWADKGRWRRRQRRPRTDETWSGRRRRGGDAPRPLSPEPKARQGELACSCGGGQQVGQGRP